MYKRIWKKYLYISIYTRYSKIYLENYFFLSQRKKIPTICSPDIGRFFSPCRIKFSEVRLTRSIQAVGGGGEGLT